MKYFLDTLIQKIPYFYLLFQIYFHRDLTYTTCSYRTGYLVTSDQVSVTVASRFQAVCF